MLRLTPRCYVYTDPVHPATSRVEVTSDDGAYRYEVHKLNMKNRRSDLDMYR